MRKLIFILPWTAVIFLTACASSWAVAASPFDDAVGVWHMADLNDSAGKNSPLTVQGNVKCGIELQGAEREASLRRGGDGRVARLDGGWLDAGQGADGELNLGGNAITIAMRVCDPSGKWKGTLMAKHGGNSKLVYNIYNTGTVFVAQVGNDAVAGVHQVVTPIGPLGPTDWHDIVFRWDGKTFQLFVDGGLRDDDEAVGVPRQGNTEPCLIGAESQDGKIKAEFRGLVDHAALWDRALSDAEIAQLSGVDVLADKRPDYYGEKYRPQFHFTAKKYWINDPNGLFYYDGVYHLCFQHMPPGRGGDGYKSWGHAVSTDLVHWKQLASAITPRKTWGGCWSGSAVVDWNNTTGFQTGKDKPIVLIVTMGGNPHSSPRCTQCIAYSVDGGKTFQYYDKNPVLGHIVENNRDPKVLWHEPTKKWIMALYLKENDYGLYASPDLKNWEHLCNLTLPGVSECPDLFELAVDGNPANKKWVFWGANGGFLLGSFDGRSFKPEGEVQKADYGVNFYAAQTWSDIPPSDGRLIQTSWMGWGPGYPGMPFDQQHSFPTEVTLRTTPDGIKMFRVPVREIEKLHLKGHKWADVVLKPGDNPFSGLTGDLFDISAEFELGNAKQFGITVRGQPVQYDVATKTLSCLGKSAPLSPENGRIKLRILVDRASLEVFANDGRTVMTMCFLPPDDNKSLDIFTKDGNVKVVSAEVIPLKSIWPQSATKVERLTRTVTRMLAESPVNELNPWKPRFTKPKEFFVLPAEKLNYDERLTAMALAGLVNRNGPRLFLRGHFAFNADADRFWLDQLSGKYAMSHTEIDLDEALAHFHTEVRGAVVCDDKLPATETVGLTLAGALGLVPAMPSMLPRLEAAGIPVVLDLRGVWTDHLTPQAWVLDTVGKRLDRRLVGLLNLRGKALGGIVDYLVMHGALVADLSSDQAKAPEEFALRDRALAGLSPDAIVWGWHGSDSEYQFVDHASKRGLRVLCATNCPNLSFLSQVRPTTNTWRQRSPAPDDRPVEKKLYMTFVLTDGDSVPILLTRQWYRWDDPVRGTIPFGWEHQPLLADLAPMVFEYYYDTMTENDQLICGPSGAGYTHPGVMPNLDWFADETNRYLRRTNLRSIGVLGDWNEQAARTMAGHIPEAVGFLYGWAEEPDRPQLLLHGKPYVPYWFSLDQPESNANGGKDAAYYARQANKIRRIVKREGLPCFLGAHLSCYVGTPGDVPKLLEALGNEIPHEVLLPDQFLHMAGKHFGK